MGCQDFIGNSSHVRTQNTKALWKRTRDAESYFFSRYLRYLRYGLLSPTHVSTGPPERLYAKYGRMSYIEILGFYFFFFFSKYVYI